ncbi:uncharacterized protein LAESUDRAFT_624007, partial [Laetiporus sulphureus 93-53]
VSNLREQNTNTEKLPLPLPLMEGILHRVVSKKYLSALFDAYDQIRVTPEHIDRNAMIWLVMQQGDCNAVATSTFMDAYLDRTY